MTKEYLESILTEYGVAFTDSLADRLLKEFEPCEDAISRQAVIDALCDNCELFKNGEQTCFSKCEEYHFLATLSSVTPQPKTGHWIEHPEIETSTPEYLMFYECSECGDKQCFCKSDIHKKRFCGNCGCRMVEPQESEE